MRTSTHSSKEGRNSKASPEAATKSVKPTRSITHCIDQIIDFCNTLEIKFTKADINYWLSTHFEGYLDKIEENVKDKFLANSITNLKVFCEISKPAWRKAALLEHVAETLFSAIGADNPIQCKPVYASSQKPAAKYHSRPTLMNTTLDRSPILDHAILEYLTNNCMGVPTIVDVGVGFPPLTTLETAKKVKDRAQVIGVDITMPDLLLRFTVGFTDYLAFYEINQKRAGFTPNYVLKEGSPSSGILQYYEPKGLELEFALRKAEALRQSLMARLGEQVYLRIAALGAGAVQDAPLALRRNARLSHASDCVFHQVASCKRGKDELIVQPLRSLSAQYPNLEFRKDNFHLTSISKADIIRVGNVFHPVYYSAAETRAALSLLAKKLKPNGLLIVVTHDNHSLSFQKHAGTLRPVACTMKFQPGAPAEGPHQLFPRLKKLFTDSARCFSEVPYVFPWDASHLQMGFAQQFADKLSKLGYTLKLTHGSPASIDIDLTKSTAF